MQAKLIFFNYHLCSHQGMYAYTPVSECVHFRHTFYFALFITHLYTLYLLIHALIYCIYLTIVTVYMFVSSHLLFKVEYKATTV